MSTVSPTARRLPTVFALWLYGHTVTKISLERTWTKDDGSDARTTLTLTDEFKKEQWVVDLDLAKPIVDFTPGHASLCRITEDEAAACRKYLDFTARHADKIALFEKLKAELGL